MKFLLRSNGPLWSLQEMTFDSEKPDAHVHRFACMDANHDRVDERTIVVGLEGSSDSDAALEWAVTEAENTGRHLLLVHALTIRESLALIPFSLVGFPDAASYGAHLLQRAADRCRRSGVAASTRLLEGSPADVLVTLSDGAAMLVAGARGRGQAATMLLGSVSQECARRGRCPVVVVKTPAAVDVALQGHERAVG